MLRHDMNHHEEHNEHRQPKAETLKLRVRYASHEGAKILRCICCNSQNRGLNEFPLAIS